MHISYIYYTEQVPRAGGSPTTLACGEMRLAIDSSGTMLKTYGSRFALILAY
jgi:hypothetical protein